MSIATTHIKTKKQLVPKLRFKEFEEDWNTNKLADWKIVVLDGDRGANYPSGDDLLDEGHCLFMNAKNVTKAGFSFEEKMFITKEKDELLRKGKLKREDLVLTTRGSVGHIAYYDQSVLFEHLRINSGMVLLRNENDQVYSRFIYVCFHSPNLIKQLSTIAFGSAQPQLTVKEINKFKLTLPSLPEQQKIASFLSAVDEKIQQLTKKKALLEQYKKGVMQQLFSGQLRFKDENGNTYPDWEERKLADVLHEHKLKSSGKEEVYSVSVHKGLVNQVEHLGRVFAAKNTDNYNLVQPNDVVYTKSPTGDFPLGIIKQSKIDKNVIVSPLYGIFTPETPGLGYMLNVHFESPINTQNYLASIIQKGAKNTINITNTTFLSKKMKLPVSREEQNKIGDFLKSLDDKIFKTENQIYQTQTFKKGLLQQMFVAA